MRIAGREKPRHGKALSFERNAAERKLRANIRDWRASAIALLTVFLTPTAAQAGNSDEVNAGIDVTLSGGAVVATTYTGAALWYNPAGIARTKKASLEITGITFQTQFVRVPSFVTVGTDPPTAIDGNTVNFTVIPEAITFAIALKRRLKLGIGLFDSSIRRSLTTGEETTAPDISPEVKSQLDALVSIPMRGRVESLNVAVAAGLVSFHAAGLLTPGSGRLDAE